MAVGAARHPDGVGGVEQHAVLIPTDLKEKTKLCNGCPVITGHVCPWDSITAGFRSRDNMIYTAKCRRMQLKIVKRGANEYESPMGARDYYFMSP